MQELKPTRYKTLDLTRFFCACLVVLIHMGLDNSNALIPCLTQQAVPFFFLSSGFFFAKRAGKTNNLKSFTISFIKPICIVYLFWNALWLPYTVNQYVSIYHKQSLLNFSLILLRRIFLAGIAPYWYLLVLIEGSILLAFIIHFKLYRIGWAFCLLGFALNTIYSLHLSDGLGGIVYRFFYTVFSWNCNVIMTGFPLLFIGAYVARKEEVFVSIKRWFYSIPYFLSIVAAFFVFSHFHSLYHIPFGIIQALFLFLFCLTPSTIENSIPSGLCRWSRNCSSVIFLTHTAFLTIIGEVFHFWISVPRFFITVFCATLLTVLLTKLNNKRANMLFMMKT